MQDLLTNTEEFPDATTLRTAVGAVIDQLGLDPNQLGAAL
jgi:hypothetical protein